MKNHSLTSVLTTLFISCTALFLVGCATGPKYNEMRASIPPLSPDNGRIYIYRTVVGGAAVQPEVKLNGETVGTSQPRGFFYVDRPPGSYEISTETEVKRSLSLTLDKGQTKYVRLNIAIGFFVGHVYPELVDEAKGEQDLTKCHYTGKPSN